MDIYRLSQHLSSSCSACSGAPTAPTNLTVQVSPGGIVNFQWTGSTGATSYQLDVLQPPLGSINTNSVATSFTASGVPNGVYRVQVRAVNPVGASAPSNIVDVVVGAAAPCAPPTAPATVNALLLSGTGIVTWSGVAGADELSRRAGSTPGGSDLFDGNVGNVVSVSASRAARRVPGIRPRLCGQRLRHQRTVGRSRARQLIRSQRKVATDSIVSWQRTSA